MMHYPYPRACPRTLKLTLTCAVGLLLPLAALAQPPKATQENKVNLPEPTPTGAKTGLIPRDVLFGNPDKASPRLSPDGKHLGYLAPVDGVLNVWVGPADKPEEAKPVSKDKKRGIRMFIWAYTGRHVLYIQDTDGDEDFHVYCVDLKENSTKDLTPLKKIRAQIAGVSHKFPNEIVVGLNDREPHQFHDLYRINIETGDRKLIQKNDKFLGFEVDDDYAVRFAQQFAPDGGVLFQEPDGQGGWKDFLKVGQDDSLTTSLGGFDKSGKVVYLIDSRGRDTAALKTLDLGTRKETLVAEDPKCDAGGLVMH